MHATPVTRRYVTAAVALVAACADSTTTPQPVALDGAAFETALDALEDVLAAEPWVSFGQLGPGFVLPVAAPAPAPPARVPVVPGQFLGSTFVHDGTGYIADPSRTDAPPDGVRFALYALEPGTLAPLLDAEIAAADVRDVGTDLTDGFALDIAVMVPAGDVARYSASFEPGGAPPATGSSLIDHDGVLLAGSIAGDADVLTFELVSGIVSGVALTDVALALATADLAIAGVLSEDEPTGTLSFDVSVTTAGTTLRLTGERAAGVLEVVIAMDGVAIATLGGAGPPAVTATPHTLTVEQVAALARVAGVADTLLRLANQVVEPVEL